jgi:hypothetical protein
MDLIRQRDLELRGLRSTSDEMARHESFAFTK